MLGGVILVHALLLALAMTLRSPERELPVRQSLTLISLAKNEAVAKPAPPLPSKVPAPAPLAAVAVKAEAAPQATAAPAVGESCATLDNVSKAIVGDPAALSAVAEAPADVRSISDAIVIWNAGWSPATDQTAQPLAPLAPVRSAVLASLAGTDQRCLDESVAGPRFVPIAVGDRTRLLVFGSGNWTWRAVTSDGAAQTPAPNGQAADQIAPG